MTSTAASAPTHTGTPVFTGRNEDIGMVKGHAHFTADLEFDGLHAMFVRSPVAHGRIRSIDPSAALASPRVVAVFTAETIGLDRFVHLGSGHRTSNQSRWPLANDRVRHVGEAVALVVATDSAAAADGIEGVDVDIEWLDPIVDPAGSESGPLLYPDSGTNRVIRLGADGPDPLADAATVIELTIDNPKVSSLTLECDAIVATPTDEGLDIWCTSQGVHGPRNELAAALGLPPTSLRLRSPLVGGGFGGRATLPIEFVAVAQAALALRRPVRWVQTRSEQLTGQPHGRGLRTHIRVGVGADGALSGLDARVIADCGATAHVQGGLLVSALRQLPGLYQWGGDAAAIRTSATGWLTNTTPVGAYRGAGQPEANHARERALDVLAQRLGLDPVAFRMNNLVPDGPGPHQPRGLQYDDVAPRHALRVAIDTLGLDAWRQRQRAVATEAGSTRLGVGVACYAQTCGRGAPDDGAEVRLSSDGSVEIFCGSPAHGQGHAHTFGRLVADRLGIDPEQIRYVDADTAVVASGLSTGGSRSSQILGSVIAGVCDDIIEQARPQVADRLEVAPSDLIVMPAGFGRGPGLAVAGVPTRRIEWTDLADDAAHGCLAAIRNQSTTGGETHPFGAHASVVSVDIETGRIEVLQHVAVDDCGVLLEPVLLEGQQHGGSVAGIAQALGEAVRHDAQGNATSGTLGSYLLPSAAEVCPITTVALSTPTDRNALGTRGIGENGCNGATAAVHNAVMDALREFGVEHIDLPLDPEAIWRALGNR